MLHPDTQTWLRFMFAPDDQEFINLVRLHADKIPKFVTMASESFAEDIPRAAHISTDINQNMDEVVKYVGGLLGLA